MWILLRLCVAAAAFAARLVGRLWPLFARGEFRGTPYYVQTETSRSGRVTRLDLGMPLKGRVVFVLTREGSWDRWFKAAGLAEELQTGDRGFDEKVYVACDHPGFARILKGDAKARAAVLGAYRAGFDRVYGDGSALWLRSGRVSAHTDEHLELLDGLRRSLDPLEAALEGRFADPFLLRTLLVEGLAWSLAAYAIGSVVEFAAAREDYHLNGALVVAAGLALALALGAGLVALAKALLGGSSRAHRVLIESGVVLGLSLPVAGVQTVSDVNRACDSARPWVATRTVERTEVRVRRGRRGRRTYSYYAHWAPEPGGRGPRVPGKTQITRELHARLAAGTRARLTIGPGALGFPWYRSIEPL